MTDDIKIPPCPATNCCIAMNYALSTRKEGKRILGYQFEVRRQTGPVGRWAEREKVGSFLGRSFSNFSFVFLLIFPFGLHVT